MTLIEQLIVITIKVILAAMLLAALAAAYTSARLWIIGVYAYHENQLNIFLDDSSKESLMLYAVTNRPCKWSEIKTPMP